MPRHKWLALLFAFCAAACLVGVPIVDAQTPERLFLPVQARSAQIDASPAIVIAAFVPDGLARNDADEGFALQNLGPNGIALAGWQVSDSEGTTTLPGMWLAAGAMAWCVQNAVEFRTQWGESPACEYAVDADPAVPNGSGAYPRLANTGDELILRSPDGRQWDTVVYANGDAASPGWSGASVPYYQNANTFARVGQVFYRLFDAATGLPLPDTNAASDWAQGEPDPARGRRAAYPGWELQHFARTATKRWEASAPFGRVFVAPDNAYAGVRSLFAGAQHSIRVATYDFEHPELAAVLAGRARAGVLVHLLLEGAPVGGLTDATRWAAQQVAQAGGVVQFMVSDGARAGDRYSFYHAKFAVIDGQTLVISSENFTRDSMPTTVEDGATFGRRGYIVALRDPALVARALELFAADTDTARGDLQIWQADHPTYGAPPPGYTPPDWTDSNSYSIRVSRPLIVNDTTAATLFSAPEASLSPGPLLDLIGRAGAGDTILVQQLYEQPYWGTNSTPELDPNPRLEALFAAARRGATVRLLLDSYFDRPSDARSNTAAVAYVQQVAQTEGLDMQARVGNPTGGGIHAKVHFIAIGAERWVVIGSINGGEVSNKLNREAALAVEAKSAFAALSQLFWQDWAASAPAAR